MPGREADLPGHVRDSLLALDKRKPLTAVHTPTEHVATGCNAREKTGINPGRALACSMAMRHAVYTSS
jgi:hypothetical protein